MKYVWTTVTIVLLSVVSIVVWYSERDPQIRSEPRSESRSEPTATRTKANTEAVDKQLVVANSNPTSTRSSTNGAHPADLPGTPETPTTASSSAHANEPRIPELMEIINASTVTELAEKALREHNWTSSKLTALAQSDFACTMAAAGYSRRLSGNDRVVAPVENYLAHVNAIKHFVQTYCKGLGPAKSKMQHILDARLQINDMAELEKSFQVESMDANRFQSFVFYLNWEAFPQFAWVMAENIVQKIKLSSPIRQLALTPEINGGVSTAQLAKVYALAAEMRSCRYSRTCDPGMPYTMLVCMPLSSCKQGQSLIELRREWSEPVVFNSAQRLMQSWERTYSSK